MPIALRMVMEIAQLIRKEFPGRSLSASAASRTVATRPQFILLGADTVQVCTGVMKFGYEWCKPMCDELLAFMEKHKFETLDDFKGKALAVLHHARRPGEAPGRTQGRAKGRCHRARQENGSSRRRMERRRLRETIERAGEVRSIQTQRRKDAKHEQFPVATLL